MQRYRDEIARMLAEKLPLKKNKLLQNWRLHPSRKWAIWPFPVLNWQKYCANRR